MKGETQGSKVEKKGWKNDLRLMRLAEIEKRAPGFYKASGGSEMKIKPYTDNNANGLTRCIVDFIGFMGGNATRVNTTGMIRKINGRDVWVKGNTRKGVADVHAIVKGQHLSVEIKIGNDRLSEDQVEEKRRVEGAGGLYFVAKNFLSFLDWYSKTFGLHEKNL